MSGQVWFIWMMVALKLPVLGLGYFIYRVLRAQDEAWERGGYDIGPDDSDGGGGGGGGGTRRPSPSGPRGGPARRRARTARSGSRPLRGARLPAPARRPVPLRTRVRTRMRP